MFLPYRAKNPPEHVPYATYTLIGLNTLVYALTTHDFLHVRESAVHALAVSDETFSFGRLMTSMFLHENLLHIVGNMLFLWIFGASLEGRLRPLKFISLYFISGLCGGLLHEAFVGIHNPAMWSLGASGAIMGLAGAYLWVFPHSIICVFVVMFGVLRRYVGPADWKAQWVVLYYFGFDILDGVLLGGHDGVAHFAHIGGVVSGFLIVLALRTPRDSEQYSNAQASLATMRDYGDLNVYELETLMETDNPGVKLIETYCRKRLLSGHCADEEKCLQALQKHSHLLMEQGDAATLAAVVLQMPGKTTAALPPVYFLRLGSQLERIYANDLATRIYYRVVENTPQAAEAEAAWFRLGRLAERIYGDPVQARYFYSEQVRLFPQGPLVMDAQRTLSSLSVSGLSASIETAS